MEEMVICCMDRRLNDFLENKYGGEITPDVAVERLINCFETANEEINKALGRMWLH